MHGSWLSLIHISDKYAAECFRLDALDYLMDGLNFSTFFQSVSKAARWFSLQDADVYKRQHSRYEMEHIHFNHLLQTTSSDIHRHSFTSP